MSDWADEMVRQEMGDHGGDAVKQKAHIRAALVARAAYAKGRRDMAGQAFDRVLRDRAEYSRGSARWILIGRCADDILAMASTPTGDTPAEDGT
jgi:hypothetical protein